MRTYRTVLSIAGSDSIGGAGIQADLKTFSALGVYGMTAITALTAQNTQSVLHIMPASEQNLRLQLEAVFTDVVPDAVKIGMLHNEALIEVVIKAIDRYRPRNIVLDPVMISTSGCALLSPTSVDLLKNELMPRCNIVTPNLLEAQALAGHKITDIRSLYAAGEELTKLCAAVLIKGGHSEGNDVSDYLFEIGKECPECYTIRRVDTVNTHGTGCTLSAAIAANLALGYDLHKSVARA
ncbi:MAG: bifunctional hydroxymethylpyrimidine kinase/phosphomethylpyrimidine kinase, partial [Muribaculaceae bacterium]|nr:bifunctional hydroxymethylpyrimidine kinase/phosphomethylpyrimidine kinase [Muribaculaceae bacterium]